MKILTYNLQLTRKGQSKVERIKQMTEYLKKIGVPEVLLLQEASSGFLSVNTVKLISKELGLNHTLSKSCSKSWVKSFFSVDVAIVSKFPMEKIFKKNLDSAWDSWLEKNLWATRPIIGASISGMQIFCVHLSTLSTQADTEKLLSYLPCSGPIVVGGDFNFMLSSSLDRLMMSRFHQKTSGKGPDFIYFNKEILMQYSYSVFDGNNGPVLSDHVGILAII